MALSLKDLLNFEDKVYSPDYKTKEGFLIWPVIRYQLFRSINDTYSGFDAFQSQRKLELNTIRILLYAVFRRNGFNFLFVSKLKYLFLGSGITNIKNSDEKYYNRVSDDLLLSHREESFLIEQYNSFEFRYPRIHNRHANSLVFDVLYMLLIKTGIVKLDHAENNILEAILQSVQSEFNEVKDKERNELKLIFINQILKAKAQYLLFKNLFYLKKPEIIFIEDASYGSNAYVVKAAKDQGIKVGEIQHGFVGKSHMAYNYSESVVNSNLYKEYLPDYFLTYGDFWGEEITLPSRKVTIGKPSIQVHAAKQNKIKKENVILFISSGNTLEETQKVLNIILNNTNGTDWRVKFRPHPLENGNVKERYGRLIEGGMAIDLNNNVYDSIIESECVIGDISTVLFEAMAFENKIIISYLSRHNPQVTFPESSVLILEIDDLKDISTILDKHKNLKFDYSKVWARDWEKNFDTFLKALSASKD